MLSLKKPSHTKRELYLNFTKDPINPTFKNQEIKKSLINTGKLVKKSLPNQADIDKILKVIQ